MKISINYSYFDEVECEISPLYTCGDMFGIPYLWYTYEKFDKRENKYHLVKGGKEYSSKHIERERERERERDTLVSTK